MLPAAETGGGAGAATVERVRAVVAAELPGARVGGGGALGIDATSAIYGAFPLMLVAVALVTFVLLTRAFRALLLALKAIVLNLLSIGAAYGVLVLVWQDGYGLQAVWGIHATGAIAMWVPLMAFAFLYGLSMDYEVFLLSRMREEYDATGSTGTAVVQGLGRVGQGELGEVGTRAKGPPRRAKPAWRSAWPASRAGQRPSGRGAPLRRATAHDHAQVAAAGASEQAGGGRGTLAMPAHHGERPRREPQGGAPVDPQGAELDRERARQVPDGHLAGLADVEDRHDDLAGSDLLQVAFGQAGGDPGGHPTRQLAGKPLVADLVALADQLGAVLLVAEDEHQWPVDLDQPAEPGGEGRP